MSTLSVTNDNFSIHFLLSNQVQYFIPLSRRSRKIKLNFFFFLIFIFFGISSVASLLYSFLISKDEIQLHFYIHITVFNIDNINDIWWRKKVINCKRPPFKNKKLTLLIEKHACYENNDDADERYHQKKREYIKNSELLLQY